MVAVGGSSTLTLSIYMSPFSAISPLFISRVARATLLLLKDDLTKKWNQYSTNSF